MATKQTTNNKITEKNLAETKQNKEVKKKIGTEERKKLSQNITKRELLVDGRMWRNREKKKWEWKLFRAFKAMNWK